MRWRAELPLTSVPTPVPPQKPVDSDGTLPSGCLGIDHFTINLSCAGLMADGTLICPVTTAISYRLHVVARWVVGLESARHRSVARIHAGWRRAARTYPACHPNVAVAFDDREHFFQTSPCGRGITCADQLANALRRGSASIGCGLRRRAMPLAYTGHRQSASRRPASRVRLLPSSEASVSATGLSSIILILPSCFPH